jgi:branched-chain amino acid transport system ATP-binding protein
MADGLLEVQEITIQFGGITALDDLSFTIEPKQICGLIGPNGAGKTTLFNVIGRIYDPSQGAIGFDGEELLGLTSHEVSQAGISRTFQNLALWPRMTVAENVMTGAHTQGKQNFFSAMTRFGLKQEEKDLRDSAYAALEILDLLEHAEKPCDGLPFGTMKRIELARALVNNPKLLLLDEPATGLTHSEVAELSELIISVREQFNLTILLVEHHMGMVMGISEKVVVLDFGSKIAEGTPSEIQNNPLVVSAYLGAPK